MSKEIKNFVKLINNKQMRPIMNMSCLEEDNYKKFNEFDEQIDNIDIEIYNALEKIINIPSVDLDLKDENNMFGFFSLICSAFGTVANVKNDIDIGVLLERRKLLESSRESLLNTANNIVEDQLKSKEMKEMVVGLFGNGNKSDAEIINLWMKM